MNSRKRLFAWYCVPESFLWRKIEHFLYIWVSNLFKFKNKIRFWYTYTSFDLRKIERYITRFFIISLLFCCHVVLYCNWGLVVQSLWMVIQRHYFGNRTVTTLNHAELWALTLFPKYDFVLAMLNQGIAICREISWHNAHIFGSFHRWKWIVSMIEKDV